MSLPTLAPVGAITDGLLTGILAPVAGDLNTLVGGINTNIQSQLSGRQLSIGVLNPATGQFVSTPSNQCYVSASGLAVDNNLGLSLGGGQIVGLGGTGNATATAGDASAIAFGNGASTAVGAANAIALGTGAAANVANSVALGANSSATRGAQTGYAAFGVAGPQTSTGEVSIGAAGAARQLTNLAAGSAATDAVNVAQLQGASANVGGSVGTALGGGAGYNAATGQVTAPSYTVGTGTYASVGGAIGALNTSVATVPLQYSTAAAPRTANPGVISNDVTLVGTAAGTPVALHNVAAGSLAAGSTDAVDGAQLNAAGASVAATLGGGATYNPTLGTVTTPTFMVQGNPYTTVASAFGAVDTALDTIMTTGTGAFASNNAAGAPAAAATGANASAGGFGASATGAGSTVVGNGASDGGVANATVLGNGARVATGLTGSNTALGQGAVAATGAQTGYAAFGVAGSQTSTGEVSIGAAGAARQLTNLAAGSAATDAVNVAQLQGAAANVGGSVGTALGGGAGYNVATGQVTAPSYTVGTGTYASVGGAIGALNTSVATVPLQYSTAAAPRTANPGVISNDVTLVGTAAGTPVALHNVAAGSLAAGSTDAVDGAQLNAAGASVAATLGGGATYNPTLGTVTTPTFMVQGNPYTTVASAFGAVDTALDTIMTTGTGAFASNNAAGAPAAAATGANASAGGFGASATGAGSTVVGNGASDGGVANATVLGNGARVATGLTGSNTALGQGAVAATGAQTGYAAFGVAGPQTSTGEVSIGAAGAARQLTNLAAGSAATDAVNVAQLQGAAANVGGSVGTALGGGAGYNAATGQVTAPSYTVGTGTYASVGGAIGALNTSVATVPLQYSTAAAPRTANPGVISNDVTLVGTAAGTPVALHNVAAGSLAAGSTDAVDGAQLNAAGASVAATLGGGATYNPTLGTVTTPTFMVQGNPYTTVASAFGAVDTALDTIMTTGTGAFASNNAAGAPAAAATGANASAGGFGASATGAGSTVVGNGASDGGVANATVLGNGARVATGLTGSNTALGQGAVAATGAQTGYAAFGVAGPQTSTGEVSIGAAGAARQLTNLAAGSAATDAVNVAQLQGAAANVGGSVGTALGGGAGYNVATGQVTAPSYTVGTGTYASVGGAIGALNTSVATVPLQYSTAAAPRTANPGVISNDVTLVGTAAGTPVALHNVAAGSLAAGSTDAVDGAQLNAAGASVAATLGGGATYNPTLGTVTTPTFMVQGNPYTTVASAFGAVDTALDTIMTTGTGAFASNNAAGAPAAAATGANASAGGFGASATGAGSTVVGNGASDGGVANATVLGNGARVATGLTGSNTALGQGAVAATGAQTGYAAFGVAGPQTSTGEVSIGAAGAARQLTNLAAGSAATDAVNVAQLQGAAANVGGSVGTALGGGAGYNAATGQVTAPSYTVGTGTYASVGGAIGALNTSVATVPLQYSTAAAPRTANPGVISNDVTLVGTAAGTPVALHNVAAGSLAAGSTDAVDGAQLNAAGASVAATLGGGATYNPTLGTVTTPTFMVQGNPYTTVASAFGAVDTALDTIMTTGTGAFASNNAAGAPAAAATGANASAGGFGASATGAGSTVVGNGASDGGVANATVLGNGARVATGLTGSNTALGQGAVAATGAQTGYAAFGVAGPQTSTGEVSIGAAGATRQLTNLAAGSAATDAVNVAQLQGAAGAIGTSISSALGGGSTYNTTTGQITGPSYAVGGNTYTSVGGAITALSTSVADQPLQYSTAAAPTTANPGVVSNDVTLVGATAGTPVALHNVAAGSLAAGSTDAVTGGQLNAAGGSLATSLGGGATFNTTTGAVTAPTYTVDNNTFSTVGGAIGALNATVNGGGGSPYFYVNSMLNAALATGTNALAAGPAASASGSSSAAIGNGATATGANSVALGSGSTDSGQANVVSVGAQGAERRVVNVAAGTLSATSTDAVNGSQLYQTNAQVASLGHTSLQYDTNGAGQTLSSVTLASDQGGPVIIHNLAPGVAASDAATVGQVQAVGASAVQYSTVNGVRSNTIALTGGQAGGVVISNLAPGVLGTDAANVNQVQAASAYGLSQANAYTDARINNLAAYTQQQISQARRDADGGIAIALAAAGLHYNDQPGKVSIAGGTSYYHDQAGIAFGINTTSEDGRVRLNAAVTGSPTMGHVEIGAVFGASFALN